MQNKLLSFLGLCQRANKLVSGEFACENAIRGNTAKLILVSEDASKNTIKKFKNSSAYYNIRLILLGNKDELGSAIGKDERAVIVITDDGFSKKIQEIYDNENEEI